jgi:hypothetical protein
MIQKNKVDNIIITHGVGNKFFKVAGYGKCGGISQISQKRMFKTYAQAVKYSIKLRDYYQAPVIEN